MIPFIQFQAGEPEPVKLEKMRRLATAVDEIRHAAAQTTIPNRPTPDEVASGATVRNYKFPELYGARYGMSVANPDNSVALQDLVKVINQKGGARGILPAGDLPYEDDLVFDQDGVILLGQGGDKNLTSARGTILRYTGTGTAIKGDAVDSCGLFDLQLRNDGAGSIGLHVFNAANWLCSQLYIREFDDDNLLLECDTVQSTIYNTFMNWCAFSASGTANGVRMLEGATKAVNNNLFMQGNVGGNLYGVIQDSEAHDNSFYVMEFGGCDTGMKLRGRTHVIGNVENCTVGIELVTGSACGLAGFLHFQSNGTDVVNADGRGIAAFMQGGGAGNTWGFSPTNTGLGFRGRVPPAVGGLNLSTSDGSPVIQRADVDHIGFEASLLRMYQTMIIGTGSIDASARLQVDSTTKGFAAPRMTTTQRDAIASPLKGLMIYNTTTDKYNIRGASAWEVVTSA